jgi:Domain of unknown function (DUF4105)
VIGRAPHVLRWCFVSLALVATAGCGALRASNDRDWSPDQAVLPYAEFRGERVKIFNIRNCEYRTTEDYQVRHYDREFDLDELTSVDFIVVPFRYSPALAHTMLSFGFAAQDYVAVSVEIRKEQGEKYAPLGGVANKFELMYVVGDERDLVGLRTNHRLDDVNIYRAKADKEQVRILFEDVFARVNDLHEKPEFYNTLTNNCTTNIRAHINRMAPGRIPYDYRVLLPGYSDKLAHELGLLAEAGSFERLRQHARVNELAYRYRDDPDFSMKIRQ